ncbi:unnamed protein product [Ambrosiozyma monospora]|uniref:NADPH:adrenodoxin oxidoreductase, mitochondrial n=2 Tax=Ambrosiozyma monospora TaxID=43982 RepID=A0A9W6Z337_AMBMO|nr:unnamed protein product [Ambrosiozyma monospora]
MVLPLNKITNLVARQVRFLSTNVPKIAIIGSGPSAFYTSINLLKQNPKNLQIDMFEQNPVPFGLSRYGVAPDHPEVKNCQDRFEEFVQEQMSLNKEPNKNKNFKFFGKVKIGKDIHLAELYKNYHSVVYAYGSSAENQLGIPGEDHSGVINSKKFVGWYNGDPSCQNLNPPLDKVRNVTIIGNGNVAIDIVRILLADPETHWANTDITETALNTLKKSTVENVVVSARRGFLESKFTNKEFKEVLEFKDINFDGWNEELFEKLLDGKKLGRVEKRRLQLAKKHTNNNKDTAKKHWRLDYLKTPVGFKVDSNDPTLLKETIFQKRIIDEEGNISDSKELTSTDNELVITSIGYKGEPLPEFQKLGVPFDSKRGMIPNIDGKIDFADPHGTLSYCTGWIANGSKGNINTCVMSSSILADVINSDLQELKITDKPGREEIEKLLENRNVRVTTWSDWLRIQAKEVLLGQESAKPFEKITDYNKMLNVLRD